jgi:uncharacterized protein YkwD
MPSTASGLHLPRHLLILAALVCALLAGIPSIAHASVRQHRRCAAGHVRHHGRCVALHRRRSVSPLAIVASVPGGPCVNTELTPNPSNVGLVEAATLCLINKQRAAYRLAPLHDNAHLDASAAQHSNDMVANNYFDHTSPSGSTFSDRILATGYVPRGAQYMLGENIGVATLSLATPQAMVTAWMNSPEHRANILTPDFQSSGISVVAQAPAAFSGGQPGATYTQDFGAFQQ